MQSENMQLLIPPDIPKRRERDRDKEDDLSLLEQITGVNPAAGKRFLEYLVVTRRSPVCDHHFFLLQGRTYVVTVSGAAYASSTLMH